MGAITKETRFESFLATDPRPRQAQILAVWNGDMTAREVAEKLGYQEMNCVRPRITELEQSGQLIQVDKWPDLKTNRRVTRWRLADGK